MSKYFHYTACGLDNVWLANGFKFKSTRHGNAVAVNDVEGLHQLIAITLIDKPGRLTGKEFRFLRTQLGLSQEALATMLGFTENSVSLWERKGTVPIACDQWLRISVLAKLNGKTHLADAIARTQTIHKLIYQKYVVKAVNGKHTLSISKARPTSMAKSLTA
jgi:DNA-binding transcriptional regulator YiaG